MPTGINPIFGRPGIGTAQVAQRRNVSRNGALDYYPAGGVIDGAKARDPGNSAFSTRALRAGLLMGKVTASGQYANSIVGVTQGAYTSGGTTITVTVAQAAEIVRRVGTSGNLTYIGPPSAAGVVAVTGPIAFSAVNTGNGQITVTSLGVNKIAGTFVVPGDGSEFPTTFIPDGYGIVIPDDDADVNFPHVPVAGTLDVAQIIDWPSDSSLKTWVREKLSTLAGGKFIFSDQF